LAGVIDEGVVFLVTPEAQWFKSGTGVVTVTVKTSTRVTSTIGNELTQIDRLNGLAQSEDGVCLTK
jgi:hypothetical protein